MSNTKNGLVIEIENILNTYAKEKNIIVRSTSDLSPLEEWLLILLAKQKVNTDFNIILGDKVACEMLYEAVANIEHLLCVKNNFWGISKVYIENCKDNIFALSFKRQKEDFETVTSIVLPDVICIDEAEFKEWVIEHFGYMREESSDNALKKQQVKIYNRILFYIYTQIKKII